MTRRTRPKDWLHPSYQRAGGHLWPPERDSRLPTPDRLSPSMEVPACDPSTPIERRYLNSRLPRMEIDPRGLDCPVARTRAADSHPRFPEASQSLQARGLLVAAQVDGRTVMVLTPDGKAALRQPFLRQMVNHALLYPTLPCTGISALRWQPVNRDSRTLARIRRGIHPFPRNSREDQQISDSYFVGRFDYCGQPKGQPVRRSRKLESHVRTYCDKSSQLAKPWLRHWP